MYRMKRFSNLSHKANEEVLIQLNSVKRQSDAVSTWLQQQRSLLDDELNNLKELNVCKFLRYILFLPLFATFYFSNKPFKVCFFTRPYISFFIFF